MIRDFTSKQEDTYIGIYVYILLSNPWMKTVWEEQGQRATVISIDTLDHRMSLFVLFDFICVFFLLSPTSRFYVQQYWIKWQSSISVLSFLKMVSFLFTFYLSSLLGSVNAVLILYFGTFSSADNKNVFYIYITCFPTVNKYQSNGTNIHLTLLMTVCDIFRYFLSYPTLFYYFQIL